MRRFPAFRIRNAALDDIPAAAAVARACDLEDIAEPEMFEDWLYDDWMRPRFDPSTDAWVVTERSGDIVAFAYTWDEEPNKLFDSTGYVHPACRERGIGTALVDAVERRSLRDRASSIPAGATIRVLQSFDEDASGRRNPNASGARALFEGLGYVPEREYLHMEIEVPDGFSAGDPPRGVVVRPRMESDDREIVTVIADGFDDPWDFEEAREEWGRSRVWDPSLWYVALVDDEMVGALFGYVANARGQISGIAVRDGWRRRGIAQALLRAAFARFRDRGVPDVRLNVDRDNAFGATHLYERVGMRLRRRWLVVAKTLGT
jgi:ribosomal protein S18 acetylase RimI-like enzyme